MEGEGGKVARKEKGEINLPRILSGLALTLVHGASWVHGWQILLNGHRNEVFSAGLKNCYIYCGTIIYCMAQSSSRKSSYYH